MVGMPTYILNNSTREFPFLHIFARSCYYFTFDDSHFNKSVQQWDLIVVLIYFHLMISDVEYLFTYLVGHSYVFFENVCSDLWKF